MKKEITNREIAEELGKSEQTIKGWKQKSPKLLEFVKLGLFCKKNDIDMDKIKKFSELQAMMSEQT